MTTLTNQIETKVYAAAIGGGTGGVLSGFLLWLLGASLWSGGWQAGNADKAISAVPSPVSALIVFLISLLGAAIGGYLAPHTDRGLVDPATVTQPTTVVINQSSPTEEPSVDTGSGSTVETPTIGV